jgi:WD40 repeat protein
VFSTPDPAAQPLALEGVRSIVASAFSADGRHLYSADDRGVIHEIQVSNQKWTGRTFHDETAIERMAASPSGPWLAAAGGNSRLTVWNTETGKPVLTRTDFDGGWALPAFSADGKIIALTTKGQKLRFVSVETAQEVRAPISQETWSCTCQFDPESRFLFISSANGPASLWDLSEPPRRIAKLFQSTAPEFVSYAPKLGCFVGSTFNGDLSFWDARTGAMARPMSHLPRPYGQMILCGDARRGLAFSGGRGARLFDVETRLPIGPPLIHTLSPFPAAIDFLGATVMTADRNEARIWQVPPPIAGEPKLVTNWAQAITGQRLDGEGLLRYLTADEWRAARTQAAALLDDE